MLLKLGHIGYVEIYPTTLPNSFLRNGNLFGNIIWDISKLVTPLVEQLALFDGCGFSPLEILWKYYCSVATSHQREQLWQESRAALANERGADTANEKGLTINIKTADDPEYLLSLILFELMNESIDKFASVVEGAYRASFEREYTGFVVVDRYLLERNLSDRCMIQWLNFYCLSPRCLLSPFCHLIDEGNE